jgi:D-glycero-alpha-D-manno-heptose-7-phosphate kinase
MEDLGRPVGKHDHYMAAYGGLRALHIDPDQRLRTQELPVGDRLRKYLRQRLLLFFTGVSRDAGSVLAAQDRMTGRGDEDTLRSLRSIHALVPDMMDAVLTESVDEIGPILDHHWRNKRKLSPRVSTSRVDELYSLALMAGADGGRLLGAGGGGFLLISSRPGRSDEIRAEMKAHGASEATFDLDFSGSQAVALPV